MLSTKHLLFSVTIRKTYIYKKKDDAILIKHSKETLIKFRIRYDRLFQKFMLKDYGKINGIFFKLTKAIELTEVILISIGKVFILAQVTDDGSLSLKIYRGKSQLLTKSHSNKKIYA